MPPGVKIRSVLNPKSASYNYPTLVSRGKGGIKDQISGQTSEKLDTFASQLEAVFYQRNRELCFRRGGKD